MSRTRKRLILACDTCRTRRTKCDGQRPSCSPCKTRGLDCCYQALPSNPGNRIELELVNMNKRLEHLTGLITDCHRPPAKLDRSSSGELSCHQDSPFRLLATSSIMVVLGLEASFAQEILRMERASPRIAVVGVGPQVFFVPQQQTASALATFSDKIHVYYPILPLDFSGEYFRVLSEPFQPSCRSCLVLLVTAIGCVAQDPSSESPYFEAALASLPIVIAECSLVSVQCLLLLAIYYSCLLKPCQAHDYCLMASFKIQNMFKIGLQGVDPTTLELTHRVYWAVLLLESELSVQLDVAKSDIWTLDDHIPLPNCRRTWQFALPPASPPTASLSPASIASSGSSSPDQAQSFFLAEIAMRRMLHRCNSAVTNSSTGQCVYAPGIALELERQLDEWYNYLPTNIQFFKDVDQFQAGEMDSLPNFLRVQYFCCRTSIYWPAVYQAMQDGVIKSPMLDHCQWFFDCYVQLIPSIVAAFQDCLIYRWSLFLSIFIITLTALKAANTPCLAGMRLDAFYRCLSSVARVDWAIPDSSQSLKTLQYTLNQRLMQPSYTQEGEDGE